MKRTIMGVTLILGMILVVPFLGDILGKYVIMVFTSREIAAIAGVLLVIIAIAGKSSGKRKKKPPKAETEEP